MSYDPISIGAADFLANADVVAPGDPVGRLLKIKDICRDLSLSRATVYRLMKDPENPFPQPVKIGMASRWLECEIIAWKEKLASSRAVLPKM